MPLKLPLKLLEKKGLSRNTLIITLETAQINIKSISSFGIPLHSAVFPRRSRTSFAATLFLRDENLLRRRRDHIAGCLNPKRREFDSNVIHRNEVVVGHGVVFEDLGFFSRVTRLMV